MLLEFAPGDAAMKLYRVEIVGLHQTQAMLYAGADILCRMNMPRGHTRAGHASAFRRQEVLRSPMRDMAADQLLATPIGDRCFDKVDAIVEDDIENLSRVVDRNISHHRCDAHHQ